MWAAQLRPGCHAAEAVCNTTTGAAVHRIADFGYFCSLTAAASALRWPRVFNPATAYVRSDPLALSAVLSIHAPTCMRQWQASAPTSRYMRFVG